MSEQRGSEHVDVEKIKQALVTAGVLKSASLKGGDEETLRAELARNHIDQPAWSFTIICHSQHYCIIVKKS
jgi:hypothetical protein